MHDSNRAGELLTIANYTSEIEKNYLPLESAVDETEVDETDNVSDEKQEPCSIM